MDETVVNIRQEDNEVAVTVKYASFYFFGLVDSDVHLFCLKKGRGVGGAAKVLLKNG